MLNKNDNFKLREIIGIENIDYVERNMTEMFE
jgi:hypothetical protein